MITGGKLKAFKDLFEIVPKTVMAEDLGQNYRTFAQKVTAPGKFTMADVAGMGRLIGVEPSKLVDLIIPDVPMPRHRKGS
jgi:hypothetical protein